MFRHRNSSALRAVEGTEALQPKATSAPATAAAGAPRLVREAAAASDATVAREPNTADQPTEAPPVASPAAPAVAAPQGKRRSSRKLILGFGALLVLALGSWYGHYWWTVGRFISLDRRRLCARRHHHARRQGRRATSRRVDVADNTMVQAGDVIARIDDGDYRLAVETARDKVATQQATIDAHRQADRRAAGAASTQAKAQLASAQGRRDPRRARARRASRRSPAREFASHQTLEQAQANRDQAVAAVQSARSRRSTPRNANVDVLQGAAAGGRAHAQASCRPRSPRPSAICPSP